MPSRQLASSTTKYTGILTTMNAGKMPTELRHPFPEMDHQSKFYIITKEILCTGM